jgi:hypothetical protein
MCSPPQIGEHIDQRNQIRNRGDLPTAARTRTSDPRFDEVRPLFGTDGNPAAWPSERGLRVACKRLNSRFVAYREVLDPGLDFHSLRRFLPVNCHVAIGCLGTCHLGVSDSS